MCERERTQFSMRTQCINSMRALVQRISSSTTTTATKDYRVGVKKKHKRRREAVVVQKVIRGEGKQFLRVWRSKERPRSRGCFRDISEQNRGRGPSKDESPSTEGETRQINLRRKIRKSGGVLFLSDRIRLCLGAAAINVFQTARSGRLVATSAVKYIHCCCSN